MKKYWIFGGIAAIIFFSAYFLEKYIAINEVSVRMDPEPVAEKDTVQSKSYEPNYLYGIVIDSFAILKDRIRRDENLSEILIRHNISHQKIFELVQASKNKFDVRKLGYNHKYILLCEQDSLLTAQYFIYEPSFTEYVVFDLTDSVNVTLGEKEIVAIERELSGTIEHSLAVTIDELGGTPQLTNDFADIFAWQIDFFRLFPGDQFKIIYEEKRVDGEVVGIGKIKGAYFNHDSKPYYAVYYNQGKGADYFDPEGKSLRKELLKYPVEFSRISSRYTGRRYHPVLKRYKAHLGTDFAAPRGTPVRSVGDGIILEARYGKYNGNFVKVKHNGIYVTQYLHMVKIAGGIRPGVNVKRGQIIGYVGSTGLANGNHLCFRFWKNGVQVDALKVELPPSEPVSEENFTDFVSVRDEIISQLDNILFENESKKLLAETK